MHIGRNISKIRELLDIKQQVLASSLGVSQQTISKIEQSGNVGDLTIERIADALGVDHELIVNFNRETIIQCVKAGGEKRSSQEDKGIQPILLLTKIFELYERLIIAEKEKCEFLTVTYNSRDNEKP